MTLALTSASVKVELKQNFTNTLDLTTVQASTPISVTHSYTDGSGANQAQVIWSDQRSLNAGANETLDLTALAGGPFGSGNLTKVKELWIAVTTVTPGYTLQVGGAAANAFEAFVAAAGDIVVIGAGGFFEVGSPVDGYTVDATHKNLKINNPSAGAVTYKIAIIGVGTMA